MSPELLLFTYLFDVYEVRHWPFHKHDYRLNTFCGLSSQARGVGRRGLRGTEPPPPKCVKGARVMGMGTLLANVTLLIMSIMQLTQLICSHDHTVRCSQ